MYQAGEVDYLVATDAIGMGLNMDVNHVCFAALRKFDGRVARPLTKAEISQIAGRAGRHMSDGTFGTTAEVGPMEPEIVDAVENHRVDPLTHLMWRRADLDFRSIDHLLRSLETRPPHPGLIRQQEAEDHQSLHAHGARSGDRGAGARARARRAAVGRLPGAGFPQADDRRACAAAGAALSVPDRRAACRATGSPTRSRAWTASMATSTS